MAIYEYGTFWGTGSYDEKYDYDDNDNMLMIMMMRPDDEKR
jgi:hypothetical protein